MAKQLPGESHGKQQKKEKTNCPPFGTLWDGILELMVANGSDYSLVVSYHSTLKTANVS